MAMSPPRPTVSLAGGKAGGEHLHPGRPPRGAGGETARPQVGKSAAGAGKSDPGRDHGDPLLLPAGRGGCWGPDPRDSPWGASVGPVGGAGLCCRLGDGGGSRGRILLLCPPATPTLGTTAPGHAPPKQAGTSVFLPPWLKDFPWECGTHGCLPPLEQELVSVGIGDNRTGEMIVLGHVKHKLVCSPDFEALLEHRHR